MRRKWEIEEEKQASEKRSCKEEQKNKETWKMKRSKIREGNEAKEVLFERGGRKRGHNRCTRGREEKTKEDTGRNMGKGK